MKITIFVIIFILISGCKLHFNKHLQTTRCEAPGITNQYDDEIKRAVKLYLPKWFDWCFLKALFYVESGLNEDARSPVGAIGIGQIMKATEKEIRRIDPSIGDVGRARNGIKAAALYLNMKIQTWMARNRTHYCIYELSWASYNAGTGTIVKAQAISGNKKCWSKISPYLFQVSGHHAVETISYVNRIWKIWMLLKGLRVT